MSLGLLYVAIHQGLLFRPDMQVAGGGSTDTVLRWYADRVTGDTPAAGVLSLPLWLYRVAMLLWALWLAASLVRGVGPAWRAFTEGGLWRPDPEAPSLAEATGSSCAGCRGFFRADAPGGRGRRATFVLKWRERLIKLPLHRGRSDAADLPDPGGPPSRVRWELARPASREHRDVRCPDEREPLARHALHGGRQLRVSPRTWCSPSRTSSRTALREGARSSRSSIPAAEGLYTHRYDFGGLRPAAGAGRHLDDFLAGCEVETNTGNERASSTSSAGPPPGTPRLPGTS